ncbi:MAG: hypothetical protein QHH01_04550 [Spirochaetales bacterium]|nr:hypothetical protein [Spirochaetales bacterium]
MIVFLFDRLIQTDPSHYQAALVSDMAAEGEMAVNWLLSQKLPYYNVILIRGQLGSAAELGQSAAELKARGVGIIFVTHFLDQVYEISDRITVLRNGECIGEYEAASLP